MKINQLINDLKKYYNKFDLIYENIKIDYLDNNNSLTFINNYYNIISKSKYSNINEIKDYILKCNKVIIINSTNSNINFYIYFNNNLKESDINKLFKLYKRVNIIYDMHKLNKNLNFHITLCPLPRILPKKNEIFEAKHVNGGITNPVLNDIYIFRKDEYIKVVLHELIHHIPIIDNVYFDLKQINNLKKNFNISNNTDILPNEAIVEFWATLYNLIFISIEYSISFSLLIKKEISFSLCQYKKIINIYKNEWYEKTNVFCYIIFKLILLLNYKKFLLFNLPYNNDNLINFIINKYDKKKLLKLEKKNNNIYNYKYKNSLDIMLLSSF